MSDRTWVYQVLDVAGALLYVGVTYNMDARMRAHRRKAEWWPLAAVVHGRLFASKRDALDVERELIGRRRPPHNLRYLTLVPTGARSDARELPWIVEGVWAPT